MAETSAQATQNLFNMLTSKGYTVHTSDINGKSVTKIEDTEIITFNFVSHGTDYGKVSIVIDVDNEMTVFYGANISKSMDTRAQKEWYSLIKELKNFALRHANGIKIDDISRLKYFGKTRKALEEGYTGTTRTSYNKIGKDNTKIIIKHTKKLGEEDKRYRNIDAIFIQNNQGERFRLPFISILGAKAMARHASNNGTPYDEFGQHICEIVNEIEILKGFVRRSKTFENDELLSKYATNGREYYQKIRKNLQHIAGKRGYKQYRESWEPQGFDQEIDEERIRQLFTSEGDNPKVNKAIPLLAKIESNNSNIKNVEDVDVFGIQEEMIREGMANTPELFEDNSEYDNFQKILNQFKSTKPIVGNEYIYVSVVSFITDNKIVGTNIAHFSKLHELVDITNKFIFDVNGKIVAYPLHGSRKNDLLKKVYLFPSTDTLSKFRTVLGLSSVHNISYKTLDEDDKNNDEMLEFEKWADTVVSESVVSEKCLNPRTSSSNFNKRKVNSFRLTEEENYQHNEKETLKKFFSEKRPFGLDALNVTNELSDIIQNKDFDNKMVTLSVNDPDKDSRPYVMKWIKNFIRKNPMDTFSRNIAHLLKKSN